MIKNDLNSREQKIVSEYKSLHKKYYGTQDYDVLMSIFNQVDPIGVADMVEDEYGPEIVRILDRLPKCKIIDEVKLLVLNVLIEEFDGLTAVHYDNFLKIANAIIENKDNFSFKLSLKY